MIETPAPLRWLAAGRPPAGRRGGGMAGLLLAAAFLCLAAGSHAAPPGGIPSDGPLACAVATGDLDPETFREWFAGQERLLPGEKDRTGETKSAVPDWICWTREKRHALYKGIVYGADRDTGPRHLRIGFKQAIRVGSILAGGGGEASVLRSDVAYPGDLANEAHWIRAERVVLGKTEAAGLGRYDIALWVLPPGSSTRAVRFTHRPQATEKETSCPLAGVYLLNERLLNIAPAARIVSASNLQTAAKLVDGKYDTYGAWSNWEEKNKPLPVAERPAQIVLAWPRPVPVCGLFIGNAGARTILVEEYVGPSDRHPREGRDGDWREIKTVDKLDCLYPYAFAPAALDFRKEVTTRALRLSLSEVVREGHPHLKGDTRDGRCVWLGEVLVLRPLGEAEATAGWPAEDADETNVLPPPLAIRVTAPADGFVTLVINDRESMRVRNLVSEAPVKAGPQTFHWDGLDDLGRDLDAAGHGLYHIPGVPVAPGQYRVEGLFRKEIDLRWEFSAYNPGHPPWGKGTGGWLANHSPPQAACFVPAERSPDGKARLYFGSYVTEGPDGFIWTDTEGRKLGGRGWIGGLWTVAPYLAFDAGERCDTSTTVYVGSVWRTGKKGGEAELRLSAVWHAGDAARDRSVYKTTFPFNGSDDPGAEIGGLAAWNGRLAVALTRAGKVLFVDATNGLAVGEYRLPAPRGLAADRMGRLLVVSETRVVRLSDWTAGASLEPVIADGLEAPRQIAVAPDGQIYVSDHGASHQVKVFSPAGKALRTVGKPGKPASGPYEPLHMNHPFGLAVDDAGRLWVAENDRQPKRVSAWSPDGTLWKAVYGPAEYGGGGRLDTADASRFFYDGMEFALDWSKGLGELRNVLMRHDEWPQPKAFRVNVPDAAIHHGGKRFFTTSFNSSPTSGHPVTFLFQEREGRIFPCAAMGRATSWDVLKEPAFADRWPPATSPKADPYKAPVFFLWSDVDGDGRAIPAEVEMTKGLSGGVMVMPDLAFVVSRLDGRTVRFAPQNFTEAGAPRYAIAAVQVVAEGVQGPGSSGGDQALVHPDGWTVMTLGVEPFHRYSVSGVFKGKPMWSYPNLWPGLHAGHRAPPPDRPGMLVAPTRLVGWFFEPRSSDCGPLWAVNSDHGVVYVFTADGLFVAQLFQTMRQGKSWSAAGAFERGTPLNEFSLGGENFWPSLTQTADGRVFLVDGSRTSLVRVDGLESLRRLPSQSITVSADDLARCREWAVTAEAARQARQGRDTLRVPIIAESPMGNDPVARWADAAWAAIDTRGVKAFFNASTKPYDVQAAMRVNGDRLHLVWRTGDAKLLENSGEEPQLLFKTGGCLDLMLGTDPAADPARTKPAAGDLRLLVTQVKGKTVATLYRPVVPGTKESERVAFSSPVSTIWFDRVEDVSGSVKLAWSKDGDYEVTVPLDLLGLQPAPGLRLRGDLGVLRGAGLETVARTYWSNKATAIVSDVPSEAMLAPALWGWMEFK